jgi:hypothetical protein
MAHIHYYNTKNPSENGPILLWLFDSKTPINIKEGFLVSRNFTVNELKLNINQFLSLIQQNKLYINVHTKQNPNGELCAPLVITKNFA